jgi:Ca2+ transporting ATPase
MFVVIVMAIFALQLLLITFAGSAFGVYSFYGLQPVHWGISVIIVVI